MAFPKVPTQIPATVGRFTLAAALLPDGSLDVRYDHAVLDAGGAQISTHSGNLKSEMTAAQITALTSLLTELRTKAQAEAI